ncbi:FlaD/FlaE family flagellar protein [Natrarchaeobaculum sulfurireducens]|uniref:Archaellum protein D/E n=1 Tax=Natrarchaeobaculum sulfurireducens TaxID=2044521 RepID=A0A346PGW6_9EURY|nr:FlaD/FlaE family flagellar protein [Natrarchaeobaculum sulfurireducens]AXR78761.1 Archaellum protein D/E [Natrarchaeobaculum sulfurireducens]
MVLFSELGGEPDDDDESTDSADDLLESDDELLDDDLFSDDESGSSDDVELTYQLDEIEKEVDSLQNRVETVRGENEKISDSIQSVERNVDKLVDLYEIVTHGVNPFVGDQEIGDAFDSAIGDSGMFGDDPEDHIDSEIAEADADDFLEEPMPFEDDDTDDFEAELDEDTLEADEPDEEFDDDTLDGALEDEFEDETLADEPLEDEFDDEIAAETDESADDLTQFLPSDEDESFEAADDSGPDADEPLTEASPVDELHDTEPELETENGEVGEPPYLVQAPSRYASEVLVLEWLDHLVETAGLEGAAQTVAYYRSAGWISAGVEGYLRTLLNGFGDRETSPPADPEPRSVLSTTEHKRSLQFIARIATPEKRTELDVDDVFSAS